VTVETIGEAYMLGWRIHARCAWGRREAMKSVRGCLGELDLHTLVWTRGAAFPITGLESRLKCPLCGSSQLSIIFDLPKEPMAKRIAGMPSGSIELAVDLNNLGNNAGNYDVVKLDASWVIKSGSLRR
jgi:hypothetical protein